MRLRYRILVATVAAVVPVVLVAGWVAYRTAAGALEAELGRRLGAVAGLLADQFSASGDAGRIARLEPDSDRIRARLRERLVVARDATGLRRIRIVDPDLQTLVDTDPTPAFVEAWDLVGDRTEFAEVLAGASARASVTFTDDQGVPFKRGWAAVSLDGRAVAGVVVEAPAETFVLLQRYRRAMALLAGIVVLLIAIASAWVAQRITLPLTALERAASRIGAGDLAHPVESVGSGEVASLGATLEGMRARLASRDEEMQTMLAGIAHEVRNPLAGMELHVGLLEEELATEADRALVGRVRRELNHLNAVVSSFLDFARERPLQVYRFDTAAITDPVLACTSGLCAERGVDVAVTIEARAEEMTGDAESIRAALQNVVQNAVQASESGATVEVTARALRGAIELEVRDHGEGIPPERLPEVMRPFFTTRQKGTGLGLALVRKTVQRHGGEVAITSTPGAGTSVRLVLPLVADAPRQPARHTHAAATRTPDDLEMIG